MNLSTRLKTNRAWVEVKLANLAANARRIQAANPSAKLLPMVKADAYGVGAARVTQTLEPLDPWGYGVATTDEGIALREIGITRPVVVFTPAIATQLETCRRHDLRPVLDDPSLLTAWAGPYHLEIDTGMGRSGLHWQDERWIAALLRKSPEGVFTHFHSADTSIPSVTRQLDRFSKALRACGVQVDSGVLSGTPLHGQAPVVHVANSAGSFRATGEYGGLVRPGIFLYGGRIGSDQPVPEPVVTVQARIVSVRSVDKGDSVSYGADWTADRPTRIATLAIGYADGIRRAIQGRGFALVHGERCPVVGRVTMDMTLLDVGSESTVQRGDVATLIGGTGSTAISLDEFAGWARTISYEVLTGLAPRLPRVYPDE